MKRNLVIALLIFSLIIPYLTPQIAYAGGAGGEPLMSDEVGWGIVGAMVIVGIYFVYKIKQVTPTDREKPKEMAENFTPVKTDTSNIVAPCGELIIAKW